MPTSASSADLSPEELRVTLTVSQMRTQGTALIRRLLEEFQDYKVARNAQFQAEIQPELERLLAVMEPAGERATADIDAAFLTYMGLRAQIAEHVDEQCRIARIHAEDERAARIAAMPKCPTCQSWRLTAGGCLDCLYPPDAKSKTAPRGKRVQS